MSEQPQLLTIKQAARMLGVTPLTLRNWDNKGKLNALRHPINNYRVYKRSDIEKLIEQIGNSTKPTDTSIPRRQSKSVKKLNVLHLD